MIRYGLTEIVLFAAPLVLYAAQRPPGPHG